MKKNNLFKHRLFRKSLLFFVICVVITLIFFQVSIQSRKIFADDQIKINSVDETLNDTVLKKMHFMDGQIVYVPAYSHIYHQNKKAHLLNVTLSIRNISIDETIVVDSVQYFNSSGKVIKALIQQPFAIKPMASKDFFIDREDISGGIGASFLVKWFSEKKVPDPLLETVMIDTKGQQGISFNMKGTVIQELFK